MRSRADWACHTHYRRRKIIVRAFREEAPAGGLQDARPRRGRDVRRRSVSARVLLTAGVQGLRPIARAVARKFDRAAITLPDRGNDGVVRGIDGWVEVA